MSNDGKAIANASCMDSFQMHLIRKGFEEFSSLTAHKLLRWQIKAGFENWIYQKKDPRLICTTGGYEGIAHLIGCGSSHKAISIVKALLHAQAYARFTFYDGSQGNIIILREVERHKNGEPSKINIILGDLLLPNYTQLLPKGEKRRLIPIPELPTMIGSNNTFAAQAFLQLLLLEEFADQSNDFVRRGFIRISQEKWLALCQEASLPKNMLQRIIQAWNEQKFLKGDKDIYYLGEDCSQLMDFLHVQGKLRYHAKKAAENTATARSPNSLSVRSPNSLYGRSLNSKSKSF